MRVVASWVARVCSWGLREGDEGGAGERFAPGVGKSVEGVGGGVVGKGVVKVCGVKGLRVCGEILGVEAGNVSVMCRRSICKE